MTSLNSPGPTKRRDSRRRDCGALIVDRAAGHAAPSLGLGSYRVAAVAHSPSLGNRRVGRYAASTPTRLFIITTDEPIIDGKAALFQIELGKGGRLEQLGPIKPGRIIHASDSELWVVGGAGLIRFDVPQRSMEVYYEPGVVRDAVRRTDGSICVLLTTPEPRVECRHGKGAPSLISLVPDSFSSLGVFGNTLCVTRHETDGARSGVLCDGERSFELLLRVNDDRSLAKGLALGAGFVTWLTSTGGVAGAPMTPEATLVDIRATHLRSTACGVLALSVDDRQIVQDGQHLLSLDVRRDVPEVRGAENVVSLDNILTVRHPMRIDVFEER